jgi:hypothetical protein
MEHKLQRSGCSLVKFLRQFIQYSKNLVSILAVTFLSFTNAYLPADGFRIVCMYLDISHNIFVIIIIIILTTKVLLMQKDVFHSTQNLPEIMAA